MHDECELAVVIGREGKRIGRSTAIDQVAGYTVANDDAIRNLLEPSYRPNLRMNNRDGCTALGPWLVSRDEVVCEVQGVGRLVNRLVADWQPAADRG